MKTMKRSAIAGIAIALILAVTLPALAFAGENQGQADLKGSQETSAADQANVSTVDTITDDVIDNNDNVQTADYVETSDEAVSETLVANQNRGAGFVDADNNGVCDNYGTGQGGNGYGNGQGAGYVDADNNGVCDNYGASQGGNGNGYGNGNGQGAGYLDANNDGVCDNRGTGQGGNGGHRNGLGEGGGQGNGHHGRR